MWLIHRLYKFFSALSDFVKSIFIDHTLCFALSGNFSFIRNEKTDNFVFETFKKCIIFYVDFYTFGLKKNS